MTMQNQLTAQQEARDNKITKIQTDGGEIQLSSKIVKEFLVSGNGNVTDQEVKLFIALCSAQKLNPFVKEAYLIKFGGSQPASMVVSKDVFQKRADANPNYGGKKSGIIVLDSDGEIKYREGAFYITKETILGGWCEVYRKDRTIPERIEVNFEEYVGKKADGSINGQWTKKPATMIRKVAVAQALREAFISDLQGMYTSEEQGIEDQDTSNNLVEVANRIDTQPVIENKSMTTEDVISQMDTELGIVEDDPMA